MPFRKRSTVEEHLAVEDHLAEEEEPHQPLLVKKDVKEAIPPRRVATCPTGSSGVASVGRCRFCPLAAAWGEVVFSGVSSTFESSLARKACRCAPST